MSIDDMDFPKTYDFKIWSDYLKRPLKKEEENILSKAQFEHHINNQLRAINEKSKENNVCFAHTTNLHGNCFFESLQYHKIITNHEEFRKDLAYLMYIFQDIPNFIPGFKIPLKEIFNEFSSDEIQIVFNHKDKKYYKYTYDAMCQDVASSTSWTKLPIQIIISVIAKIFDLQFIVYSISESNSIYVGKFPDISDEEVKTLNLKKIYLGNIAEFHYVPLDTITDTNKNLRYTDNFLNFLRMGVYYFNLNKK
jgi:hypothetical protein